jgi:hypothetical protein
VQTPERRPGPPRRPRKSRQLGQQIDELWALTGSIAAASAAVLVLSTFMAWYSGDGGGGVTISVTGWHTGALGKLTFLAGLAALVLLGLRRFGIVLPASVPESLVLIGLGVLATVFVLYRLIWVPIDYVPVYGRGIGLWVGLLSAIGLILAGLLETADEL